MKNKKMVLALLAALSTPAMPVLAQLTEAEFLSELPVVYSVTRLPTAQADTPGAVTVLDREMIRRSGAREVAELLRLVPGYMYGGENGARPVAMYHAVLDELGGRNQVYIDGRSVYSTFYLGDTHRGTMGVLIEDIERIEVLRGANSATYGANAILGVINIVTRHAADSLGGMVSVAAGEGATSDVAMRYGWQTDTGAYRISIGSRADSGFLNAHDDKRLNQLHLRGDLVPTAGSELMLVAAVTDLHAGMGFAKTPGNALRTQGSSDASVALRWRAKLEGGSELMVSANVIEERHDDSFAYSALPGVVVDFSGIGRRQNIELQHSLQATPELRAVWTLAASREAAYSMALYAKPSVVFSRTQLSGNLEWRPERRWVINAGGLVERHNSFGSEVAPRLGVNYHAAPGHTLRVSATQAFRMPSPFEARADVRYYLGERLVGRTFLSRGNIDAEQAEIKEIGYLGEFLAQRMTLDVRVFDEQLTGLVQSLVYQTTPLPATGRQAKDHVNADPLGIKGVEYQWRWKPLDGLSILANQTFMHPRTGDRMQLRVPHHIGTLAIAQQLPGGFELSGILAAVDTMTWMNSQQIIDHTRRLDLRLGYRFRLGANPAEAALTVQAADGDQPVYDPLRNFLLERRALASLRIDF